MGSNAPNKRELDDLFFRRSRVVVDFREQALAEAGDLQEAVKTGATRGDSSLAELSDIITGTTAGRQNDREITLFTSVGMAIQDVATATFIYERALATGVGQPFDMKGGSADGVRHVSSQLTAQARSSATI